MTAPVSGIRRFHHVAILTRSIERSVDHYVAMLGVDRPVIRTVDRPGLKLRTTMIRAGQDAETWIQLLEPEIGPGVLELERDGDGSLFEVAFEVGDIEAAATSFRSDGATLQDLAGDPIEGSYLTAQSGNRFFYLSGDATLGTRTEILQPTTDRPAPSPAATTATGAFAGRVAVVTGGASGIGEAIVAAFIAQGARVAILDLQQARGAALAERLGGADRCLALEVDVTDPDIVRSAIGAVISAYGAIDIAVNCAGLNRFSAPEAVDDEMWRRMIAINLDGPWNVCSAVMPQMIARRSGRIINISSAAGVLGIPKAVPYSAAKHGVVGLTRSLAVDLGQYGITVNCIAPGTTLTPLVEQATSETFKAAATERTPMGRLGLPSDLAAAVLFLASDDASWITGVTLPVDGGMTAAIRAHHWE